MTPADYVTGPPITTAIELRAVLDNEDAVYIDGQLYECRYAKDIAPHVLMRNRERLWGMLSCRADQPTHWQPLPDMPTAGGQR